jgi:hypothetical protein
MKNLLVVSCIIMMLGVVGSSQYLFGTKVTSTDDDFGDPLRFYAPPNPGAYFSIGYWETNVVIGYDNTDVVYLHQGPLGGAGATGVQANDIRLTPFDYLPAGSKVTPQDNDIGMPLDTLSISPGATIGWVNNYGGPGQDLNDPVYIHNGPIIGGITLTATNDIRLTDVAGRSPGSKVGNLDPDLPNVFSLLVPGSPNPITTTTAITGIIPLATIPSVRYVDINGNNQYDYPDDVYLCAGAPFAVVVRVNDVRLSGPV